MNGAEEALLVFWGEKWIKGSSFLCTSGGEAFLGGFADAPNLYPRENEWKVEYVSSGQRTFFPRISRTGFSNFPTFMTRRPLLFPQNAMYIFEVPVDKN